MTLKPNSLLVLLIAAALPVAAVAAGVFARATARPFKKVLPA